jgi:hypothetical protein
MNKDCQRLCRDRSKKIKQTTKINTLQNSVKCKRLKMNKNEKDSDNINLAAANGMCEAVNNHSKAK